MTGFLDLAVACSVDLCLSPGEPIARRHIADGAVHRNEREKARAGVVAGDYGKHCRVEGSAGRPGGTRAAHGAALLVRVSCALNFRAGMSCVLRYA